MVVVVLHPWVLGQDHLLKVVPKDKVPWLPLCLSRITYPLGHLEVLEVPLLLPHQLSNLLPLDLLQGVLSILPTLQEVALLLEVEDVPQAVATYHLLLLHQVRQEQGAQEVAQLRNPLHPLNLLPLLNVPFVKSDLKTLILYNALQFLTTNFVSLVPGIA